MLHLQSRTGLLLLATTCMFVVVESQSTLGNSTCTWNTLAHSFGTARFLDDVFSSRRNQSELSAIEFQKLLVEIGIGQVYLECKKGETRLDCIKREKDSIHDHATKTRHRRSLSGPMSAMMSSTGDPINLINHTDHLDKHFRTCFEGKKILQLHRLNSTSNSITKEQFLQICPSLISQLKSHRCQHLHSNFKFISVSSKKKEMLPALAVWGYGALSVLVISLLSLSVIAIIPCLGKSYYHVIMAYLVALAVGCLSGDAVLHLIPHSFTSEHAHEDHADHLMRVWKSMFVLLGIYLFFTVEQVMKSNVFCCVMGHSHASTADATSDEHGRNHNVCGSEHSDLIIVDEKDGAARAQMSPEVVYHYKEENGSAKMPEETGSNLALHTKEADDEKQPHDDVESNQRRVMSCESDLHDYGHGGRVVIQGGHYHADDRHHHHHHGHKEITKETAIASVAWMVIVGDGFHNFSDGLAIGAAYATSLTSGFSTSIAVFCHELPHELGDFAVLIKSGMSVKQAIVYNLVSAMLSFLGLAIGILVGNSALGRQFILAMTAGLFLYVALADMLPELTSQDIPNQSRLASFVCQHIGILSGIGIMLLISIYEEDF